MSLWLRLSGESSLVADSVDIDPVVGDGESALRKDDCLRNRTERGSVSRLSWCLKYVVPGIWDGPTYIGRAMTIASENSKKGRLPSAGALSRWNTANEAIFCVGLCGGIRKGEFWSRVWSGVWMVERERDLAKANTLLYA